MDTNDNNDDDDDNDNDNDYDIADEDTRMRLRLDAGRLEDELQEAKEDVDFYKHKYLQLVREGVTREVEDTPRLRTTGMQQKSRRIDVGRKRGSEAIPDLASSSIQSREGKEQNGIEYEKLGESPDQSDRDEHIRTDTGDEVNGHGSVSGTRPGAAGGMGIDDHANGTRGDLGADMSQSPSTLDVSQFQPNGGRKGSTSISLIHPHPPSSSRVLTTSPCAGIKPSKVHGIDPISHSSLRFNLSSKVESPSIPLDDLHDPAHTSTMGELPVPDQMQQSNLVLRDSSKTLPGSNTGNAESQTENHLPCLREDDSEPDGFSLGSQAVPYTITLPSLSLPAVSTSSSHAQSHAFSSSSSNISTLGFLDNSYGSGHVPEQSRPSTTMINHDAGRSFDVPQSTNLAIANAESTTGETAIIFVNGESENPPSSSTRSRLGHMVLGYTTPNTIPDLSHASESRGSIPNSNPIPDNQVSNCDSVLATSARSGQNRIGGPEDGNEVPYECTGPSLSTPSSRHQTDSYIPTRLAHNSMIQLPSLPSLNLSASPSPTLNIAPHRPGSAVDAPHPNFAPPLATRPERPGWISAQNRLQASRPPPPGTSSKPDIVLRGIFNPKKWVGVPKATTEFGSTSSSKLASVTALHPTSDTASTTKWGADTSRIASTSSTQAISFLPSATDDLDRATPITAGIIPNNTAIDHTTAPMSTSGVRFDDPLAARAIDQRTFNVFAVTPSSSDLESSLEPNSNKDIPSLPIPYTPRFNIFAPKADPPLKHPLPPFRDMSTVPSIALNSEVNLDLLDYTRTTISSPGTDWTASSIMSSPYHRSSESDPRHLQPDPVQPSPRSYPPGIGDNTNFSSDDEDEDTCTMVTRPHGLVQQSSSDSESDPESDTGFDSELDLTSASMKRLSAYFKSDEFLGRLDPNRPIRAQDRNDPIGNGGPSISLPLTSETAVRPAIPSKSGTSTLFGRLNRSAFEMGGMVATDEETGIVATGEGRDRRKGKGKANLELAYQNAGANQDHRSFKHQSTEDISTIGQIGPDDPVFDYNISETQETRSSHPSLNSSTPPGSSLKSYHPLTSTIVSETTSTPRSPLSSFVVDIGSQEIATATAQPTSVSPNLPVTPAYDPSSLFAVHHPDESQIRKSRKRRLEALAQDEYQYPVEETGKFFFDPHYYDSPVPIQRSPPIRSHYQLVLDGRHQSPSPPPSPRPKREFRMYNRNSVSGELKDPGWMTDYDEHVDDEDEVEALPQTHLVPLPSINLEGGRAAPGQGHTRDDELDEWLDQSLSGSLSLPSLSPSLSQAGSLAATRVNPGSSSASGTNGTATIIPASSRAEANRQQSSISSLSSFLPTCPETQLSASSIESPSAIKAHLDSGQASLQPRLHLGIPTRSSTFTISNRSGSSSRNGPDIQGLEIGLDRNSESATSRSDSHYSSKETLSIIESIIEEASHYEVERAGPSRLPSVPVPVSLTAPTSAPAPIITPRPTLPVPSTRSNMTRGHDRPRSDTGLDPNNSRNNQFNSDSSSNSNSDSKSKSKFKSKSRSNPDPDSHSQSRSSHAMPSTMTRSRPVSTSGTSLVFSTESETSGFGSSKQQESVMRNPQAGGDIQRDEDQFSMLIQGQGQGLQESKKDKLSGMPIGKGKGKVVVGAKERKEDEKGKKEVDYDEAVAQMLRFCPRDRLVDWAHKMSDDLNSDS